MRSLQARHQLEDLRLRRHVERGRRLVCDEELRAARERHRDHDALPHATRELVRVAVDPSAGVRDSDLAEQRRPRAHGRRASTRARGCGSARRSASRPCRRASATSSGPGRSSRSACRGWCAAPRPAAEQVAPLEADASADLHVRISDQPEEAVHRDALARSRLAHDAEHLARPNRQRQVIDGAHEARARAERHLEVLDLQQGLDGLSHAAPGGRGPRTARRRPRLRARRRTRRTARNP